MEMGSSSLPTSGASGSASGSSDSSINGLKFGKKIYFEDVGSSVVSAKTSGGGSGSKKGKRVAAQGGGGQQPPRCQVEACKVDLSGSKAYYCRHKVCGMHSKSPKVMVAGIEQRFCQQCSRFHQLSEFDQGKRSCRRRLAGHNERRRKPPPGSLLSRFGRLSSSYQEDSRVGGFLMDFSYPKLTDREQWPTIRTGDRVLSNHTPPTVKCIPHQIQRSLETPADVLNPGTYHPNLQGTASGTYFSAQGISTGEPFSGVSNSSCALSLLSDQPWGYRNQAPAIAGTNFMEGVVPQMVQPTTHNAFTSNLMSSPWNFKGHETSSSSHEVPSKFGLGQLPESICGSQFSGELELSQHGSRQDMDLRSLRGYGASREQMHWPL